MDTPYTFATSENPVHISAPSDSHGLKDFGIGEAFRTPYIDPNPNKWNATSEMFQVLQADIAAATPTRDQLDLAGGSSTLPNSDIVHGDYANANVNTDPAKKLNLCSQNFNNFSAGVGLASSLLPNPGKSQMGQESFCDMSTKNVLANQVFLSASAQLGLNTTSGSNRHANYDIRSAPPNPMLNVTPFGNPTVYPDLLRRPLEAPAPSFGLYGNGPNSGVNPVPIQM